MKNNELVNAINRKIKELGIKGDIKTLQPKFFDKDGKIEVYSNREVKNMEKSDKFVGGTYTKDYITNGVLPTPPVCDPLELQIDITKKFVDDTLKLAVFSPCAGTAFSLNSTCKGQGR